MLTERVDIEGVPVTLVDTAGLRESGDAIEVEGVRRARQAEQIAALAIRVVDGSQPLGNGEGEPEAADGRPRLTVVSKSDLPRAWDRATAPGVLADAIEISAVTGAGLDRLRGRMLEMLTSREEWRDPPALSNARHLQLVGRALGAVGTAVEALSAGATEELALAELVEARHALEEVRGARSPDALLAHIFGRFCVGK
jgi:tRNA modification GTPase